MWTGLDASDLLDAKLVHPPQPQGGGPKRLRRSSANGFCWGDREELRAVTFDLLLAFVAFGFVTAVTPGPNNVMLLASGVNFGFLRSVPHILGTAFGMVVMIAGVGVGLGGLFRAYPVLYGVLRWVGAAYLLYLAWRIAGSGAPKAGGTGARPMGFWAPPRSSG